MMIAPASALPPSLAPPAGSVAPEAAPPSQSFARLLAQRREQPPAPHPAGPAREAAKGRDANARSAATRADAKANAKAETKTDVQADAQADAQVTAQAEAGSVDPALAAWLAGLHMSHPQQPDSHQPAAPVTAAAPADTTAATAADGDGDGTLKAIASKNQNGNAAADASKLAVVPEPADLARPALQRGERRQNEADTDTDSDSDNTPKQAAAAAAETHESLQAGADKLAAALATPAAAAAAPLQQVVAVAAPDAALAAASTQAVATPAGHDAARPLPVLLNTPVTAPEFPQAMGVHIGVLARDGIEHAELQLNPAEMGPVSVRIVVDGAQARVDFGADHFATRQAIEASLPELAGALRDAGFTLTGGGVSQHAHPQRDGSGQGQTGRGGTGARGEPGQPGDTPAAPQRQLVHAGGVDVYA